MQFDSLAAFLAMGGHGVYVWLSYGATLLVLAGYTLALRSARIRLMNELRWQTDTRIGGVETDQPGTDRAEMSGLNRNQHE